MTCITCQSDGDEVCHQSRWLCVPMRCSHRQTTQVILPHKLGTVSGVHTNTDIISLVLEAFLEDGSHEGLQVV